MPVPLYLLEPNLVRDSTQTSGLHSMVKFHLDRFLVSPLWGEEPPIRSKFKQIFTFWGLWCQSPFTDLGQIRRETVDPPPRLTCQISSEFFYCVALH